MINRAEISQNKRFIVGAGFIDSEFLNHGTILSSTKLCTHGIHGKV
jgi:hypothetical protein